MLALINSNLHLKYSLFNFHWDRTAWSSDLIWHSLRFGYPRTWWSKVEPPCSSSHRNLALPTCRSPVGGPGCTACCSSWRFLPAHVLEAKSFSVVVNKRANNQHNSFTRLFCFYFFFVFFLFVSFSFLFILVVCHFFFLSLIFIFFFVCSFFRRFFSLSFC